jgi:probable rRNA maturation factor
MSPRAGTAAATIGVDVSAEGVRVALSRARVGELVRAVLRAEGVKHALLSVTFVDAKAIARLNREHLGHRGATDVISFGLSTLPGAAVVGDIYIAPDVARENARAHGSGVREEIARLVVHGTLHVLGHEHPTDDQRTASPMWTRQERLLARFLSSRKA